MANWPSSFTYFPFVFEIMFGIVSTLKASSTLVPQPSFYGRQWSLRFLSLEIYGSHVVGHFFRGNSKRKHFNMALHTVTALYIVVPVRYKLHSWLNNLFTLMMFPTLHGKPCSEHVRPKAAPLLG